MGLNGEAAMCVYVSPHTLTDALIIFIDVPRPLAVDVRIAKDTGVFLLFPPLN